VCWVLLQELEVFVGPSLEGFRQARQRGPETSGGAVHLHFLESPFGLLLVGLTHQEIEPSSLRVGFDLFELSVLPQLKMECAPVKIAGATESPRLKVRRPQWRATFPVRKHFKPRRKAVEPQGKQGNYSLRPWRLGVLA
jgi:hypothetical protein